MTTKFNMLLGWIGVVGGAIIAALGGWGGGLQALVTAIVVDYVTGVAVAMFWNNSTKSDGGALDSKAGFRGLARKGVMLLIVWIGYQIDILLGFQYARNALILAFLVNELISITENTALMGVPIPAPFMNMIDMLKKKEDGADKNE